MKRSVSQSLLQWHQKSDRKPLILRGARQVGKSTAVKMFAKEQHLDLMLINLEKQKFSCLEQNPFRIEDLLLECQVLSGKRLTAKSLLFFDEIQEQPKLIQFLRYFYEEKPEIAVVSAGSLLEIRLKQEEVSFPVGRVEFLFMGPMTFNEFLWANGHELLVTELENLGQKNSKSIKSIHQLALQELQKYLFVGGMPKAVLAYKETRSPHEAREIQDEIILTYQNDFPKYNQRIDFNRIARIFTRCAHHIGRKVKYQELDELSSSRDIRRVVELLIDAQVLLPCYHSNATQFPLASQLDARIFKLYFLDVGLTNSIQQISWTTISDIFSSSFHRKGEMAEQFVAQHLCQIKGAKKQPELFYWLNDKGSQKGEIDFLIERNEQIYPVEIKATSGGQLKSLFYFSYKTNWHKGFRLSTQEASLDQLSHKIQDEKVLVELQNFPLYQIENFLKLKKSKELEAY